MKAYGGKHYSSIHSNILGAGRGVWSSPLPGCFTPPPPQKDPPGPSTGMVALNCWCAWCYMKFVQRTQNVSVFWCSGEAVSCDMKRLSESTSAVCPEDWSSVCFQKGWYPVKDCKASIWIVYRHERGESKVLSIHRFCLKCASFAEMLNGSKSSNIWERR